jgi:hypothetical protein
LLKVMPGNRSWGWRMEWRGDRSKSEEKVQ